MQIQFQRPLHLETYKNAVVSVRHFLIRFTALKITLTASTLLYKAQFYLLYVSKHRMLVSLHTLVCLV